MDIALEKKIETKNNTPITIRATDLLQLFDSIQEKINVLSLDCFDTLLWRKTAFPKDVFYQLQQHDIFRELGITAMQRISAESQVRRVKFTKQGTSEVHLDEIYRDGFPSLSADQIKHLVDAEITAEMEACYAFPALLELIRYAHEKNKKVIIVSNTYLSEHQLRSLLQHILPNEIYSLISEIFCSSDNGYSKSEGLFDKVLMRLKLSANQILHVGDNYALDCLIPSAKGMIGAHLMQFNSDVTEWIRLHSLAATLTNPTIHDKKPLYHIYRGLFSSLSYPITQPEAIIGYLSFGPILYAFAQYLINEIKTLENAGKKVKILFLMRDGYLLHRAYEAALGQSSGQCVRISRFSSIAASFKTEQDVIRYLSSNCFQSRFEEVCEQLLVPADLSEHLIATANASDAPEYTFNQLILERKILEGIFERSAVFRQKLIRYLKKETNIQSGDSVVLVDVGYIGRTQRVLTPVLLDELGVKEVIGRYLISMNIPEWQQSRSGLIDPSWCDDRIMSMLSTNLALLEEVCSSCDQSVKNYTHDGDPIFSPSNVNEEQRQRVKAIQTECLRFIMDAQSFFHQCGIYPELSLLKESALYEIIRREYFPMVKEIQYFTAFRHDKNKSSRSGFSSFDGPEKEFNLLKQRGLCFSEQHAYGLRAAHLSYSLAVMTQRRFGFEVHLEDMSFKREWLTVVMLNNQKTEKHTLPAIPTDDGYYSLWFPLEKGNIQIAILFGMNYHYFQIESAEIIRKNFFYQEHEKSFSHDVSDQLIVNQLTKKGKNLFESQTKSGALIFSKTMQLDEKQNFLFRIIFRPVLMQS